MSDCEETDFVWESWTSPKKRKRKKHKKNIKQKNEIRVKTDDCIQNKKSKFKEAMEARKEKKKKKNKQSVGSGDSFIFTQGYSGATDPVYVTKSKAKTSHHLSTEKRKPDHLTEDSKIKRKQKVAFDLSPGYIRVKRPKFASSSTKQKDAVINSDSCSQVTVMAHSHCQPQDNDSQCTSDMNSQDVFITQKTFKTLPSEHSSGEASDKAVIPILQPLMQQERGQYSSMVQNKHREELNTHLQESHFHEDPEMTKEWPHSPKEVETVLTSEEGSQQNLSKETWSCQREMELNKNLSEVKKISGPVHVKPTAVNFYLDHPIVINCSKNVAKPEKHDSTASEQSPSYPCISTASIFTQTENFFTTELSSYLSFCQKSRVTVCCDNLKPLDLSLPQRARKNFGMCLSGIEVQVKEKMHSDLKSSSLPGEIKGTGHKDTNLCPSDVEVKKESSDWQLSVSAQRRSETTLSPQSEPEPKSADTTTSSEDNEPQSRTGKPDLTQVRAVQMRLNESFFFKTKGERQSPRPQSPLMKLAQGRETKSIKAHRAPKEGCK